MGPRDTWDRMADWLRSVPGSLPATPTALLVVSAHWEAPVAHGHVVGDAAAPLRLLRLSAEHLPAQVARAGIARARARVSGSSSAARASMRRRDAERGFDHGVFIPLKVAYPEPRIPTVQLSLRAGLDPARAPRDRPRARAAARRGRPHRGQRDELPQHARLHGPAHARRVGPLRRLAREAPSPPSRASATRRSPTGRTRPWRARATRARSTSCR